MNALIGFVAVAGISVARVATAQAPARWTVDATPSVTIGASEADTNDLLARVVGATRLPDGRILVGDHATFSLRLFSAEGKPLRAFGRKGAGPGEIGYLKALLRCGDSIVTQDVDAQRVSVFSLAGAYVRSFRFGSPQAGRPPYQSVCNGNGTFAHFGWETLADMKGGTFRPLVPFWLSGAGPDVRRVVGQFPGSERHGIVVDGQPRGTRPLPLGKQPVIALGADRLYIGTADRYEIMIFDLSGNRVGTIRKPDVNLATTDDDIAYVRERAIAGTDEGQRAGIERAFATMALPKTIPAYRAMVVDAAGYLWVQSYPRRKSPTVAWSVFDSRGRQVAEVALPVHLEVYEIGQDYVLGRFLDPEESIPQVRMYGLRRGPMAR